MTTAEVGEIQVFTDPFTISGPGKMPVEEAFHVISHDLFTAIVDTESTMMRRKYNDAFLYTWRGGVLGYYWPNNQHYKYAITHSYAEVIKYDPKDN